VLDKDTSESPVHGEQQLEDQDEQRQSDSVGKMSGV
jgi:hypothetical protein